MPKKSRAANLVRTLTPASLLALGSCSDLPSNDTGSAGDAAASATGGGSGAAPGGATNAGGAAARAGTNTSGASGVGGAAGSNVSAGGSAGASGAVSTGGNGAAGMNPGGSTAGGSAGDGGVANSSGTGGNGGAANAGGVAATGGSVAGGGASGSAGSAANGGAGGSSGRGGAAGNGGSTNAGGGAGGGAAGTAAGTGGGAGNNAACPGASATEFGIVRGWLNDTTAVGALPAYAYSAVRTNFPAGPAFDRLSCSIAMSCVEFAPMETDWLRKCEALLTSAIVAESSYNPASVVVDSYATRNVGGTTANDPTVGLLQIRFSSTVHDYNYYGSLPKMAAIGCTWPAALSSQADNAAFWATAGGTTYLSFMQDVACNIGLASWYYFYNATGNGGANVAWIADYCGGRGSAGNMVIGLISHLQGGNFTRPADANNAYPWGIECCACGNPSLCSCTGCTGRFAAFMGIGTASSRPNPDPFQEALAPEVSKYCR